MNFNSYSTMMKENFNTLAASCSALFTVRCDTDALYDHYQNSFPADANQIFRTRREHDCSECRRFIRQIGNVVAIVNGKIVTIWDFDAKSESYNAVNKAMGDYLRNLPIENAFITDRTTIGTPKTYEVVDGQTRTWTHFSLNVPGYARYKGYTTLESILAGYRTDKELLERSLNDLTFDSVETVLELIAQNSLYRGGEWQGVLGTIRTLMQQYRKCDSPRSKELFLWQNSVKHGSVVCRIRNHSMGTLLVDLSAGMDIEQAVHRYESVVAPSNYKRPKAIFTQKMLEAAKQKLIDLGFMDSIPRRHAVLDDITVNNILFCNRDSASRILGADVFTMMAAKVATSPKKFDRVEEITADKFISDVLPLAKEIEVLFENKHIPNLVSLIAPQNPGSKTMFKWNNNFSWAYKGNVTDSDIKRNVKSAGGAVDGVLRFSIQWNDIERDMNDLDAHCQTPIEHIYFGNSFDREGGELDVDIIDPIPNKPAVENITWPSVNRMSPGRYQFFVRCFNSRGGKSGFRAEIAFNGETHSYQYNQKMRDGENVNVATVNLDRNGNFTIDEHLPSVCSSTHPQSVWNLDTMQFVPVTTVMYSPNYWDEQPGIGHKHVFFMLKDCVNDESPNGMYNEFLINELNEHRRVLEALGSASSVAFTEDQLSGIGFSTTKRNDLIVKVKGATERILKVKF